ncbi:MULTISPECIES: alpha/beta fold hydrolase [unclassified Caballeronia]|uniref:alpha/beta fold hydrolase n=1 Tax=unclassified Caballeronia TaxID=2646786 RepID=UPI003857F08A
MPGFGESRTRRAALSIPELADALHLWLKASGIERASFVGNSFGCQILTDFAMRYPHAVDRLVLQGPTVDHRARHLVTQVLRDRRNGRLEQARSSAPIGRIGYAKVGLVRAFATMRALIARAAYAFVVKRARSIVLHGYSLGSGVATRGAESVASGVGAQGMPSASAPRASTSAAAFSSCGRYG